MTDKIEVERENLGSLMYALHEIVDTHDTSYAHDAIVLLEGIIDPTPPMTEADWQRVIDGEFYIMGEGSDLIENAHDYDDPLVLLEGRFIVVRVTGVRQPHFKGHPHPEGGTRVAAYCFNKDEAWVCRAENVLWDDVREYILL